MIQLLENPLFLAIPGFVLGAILGSFISMASYRWPRGESWGGRSKCPVCGRQLGVRDLVPIVSYFWLGKKCSCGAAVSPRYPAIECATAVLCAIALAYFGLTWLGGMSMIFVLLLMLMIVIDLENFIIPDALGAAVFVLGLAWAWVRAGDWAAPLWGMGAGAALFILALMAAWGVERACKTEALGGGDLKLLFAAGPWVGLAAIPLLLVFSGIFGILFGVVWRRISVAAPPDADGVPAGAFPFGPAICLGVFACVLLQDWAERILQ